jgi:hypothetical protein
VFLADPIGQLAFVDDQGRLDRRAADVEATGLALPDEESPGASTLVI